MLLASWAERVFGLPSAISDARVWRKWASMIGDYVIPAVGIGLILWSAWPRIDWLYHRLTRKLPRFAIDLETAQTIRYLRALKVAEDWPRDRIDLMFGHDGLEEEKMPPALRKNLPVYRHCGLVENTRPFNPQHYSSSKRGNEVAFGIMEEQASLDSRSVDPRSSRGGR